MNFKAFVTKSLRSLELTLTKMQLRHLEKNLEAVKVSLKRLPERESSDLLKAREKCEAAIKEANAEYNRRIREIPLLKNLEQATLDAEQDSLDYEIHQTRLKLASLKRNQSTPSGTDLCTPGVKA